MKKILVTGVAGFIGSSLTNFLLEENNLVYGIDNFDPFYDRKIKEKNLKNLLNFNNFIFIEGDFGNVEKLLGDTSIDLVIHLAAKPGVRPSIENPEEFIDNNINKTHSLLNWIKKNQCKKLIFASSSSVYGNNKDIPFSESHLTDDPISPYAFTKKSGELLNFMFHHLYQIDVINLRFFTVYGERQRPDLAIHKFFKSILNGDEITLFGDGSTSRDYTYIGDIINGILGAQKYLLSKDNIFEIVNLGSFTQIKLIDLVKQIENITQKQANIKWLPMQDGDVNQTFADISKAQKLFDYQPLTSLQQGLQHFYDWYVKKDTI